jgi:hypothetical protein
LNSSIEPDIVAEARRIVAAAEQQSVVLRLLGGLAVRLHAPSATHRGLERPYADIDLAAATKRSADIERLIVALGYTPDKAFNLLNGATRLLFHDMERERQIDVFVGEFDMCHRVPITGRIDTEPLTLPLAELLLTKLQVVQLNDKDVRDMLALLLDHPVGDGDDEMINGAFIARLGGSDWGLWKTVTLNLDHLRQRLPAYDIEETNQRQVMERIETLMAMLDAAPKTLKWKTRAAVGTRMQWYTLPEEVERG